MAFRRQLLLALITLALLYAALAGLRTVGDADLGWQLATGRYVVEHREIPARDVLSHTARGREFIYPPFSGVLFYLLYLAGGYPALSWLGALASVGTASLLLSGGGGASARIANACLVMVAVPLLAARSKPRSDMFSTLLFAAVLVILWQHLRGRRSPLWLLPVIMCAWVNLHLGFAAGLLLMAAYVGMELLEAVTSRVSSLRSPASSLPQRPSPLERLRIAAPWLAGAVMATMLNRWGPYLYTALSRQNRVLSTHESFVGEWFPLRVSMATARAMLDWRNPDSGYLWLAVIGLLAVGVAAWRRQIGPALLLAGALAGSMRWVRFQALFAMIVVVVAADLLVDSVGGAERLPGSASGRVVKWAGAGLLLLLTAFVGVRAADLVSNRAYLSVPDDVIFGPGVSYWYPQRAADFVLRERLPRNLINDYNIGGYLTWAVGPAYPTSLDNRAVPFGDELFYLHRRLLSEPPDSPLWRRESERWGFNTLLVGISRYSGSAGFPLKQSCESQAWRPVYLDETAAVFVRNRPENAAWIQRLQIDCSVARFTPPASRDKAELYNFYVNAGWVLSMLARDAEALACMDRAERIFSEDPQFYLIKGSMLQANGRLAEAEQQYRAALRLRESDQAWYAIGQAEAAAGRYAEAAEAIGRAARYANFPHEIYRVLGDVYLAMNQPRAALRAFDRAESTSRYRGAAAGLGIPFRAHIAAGRALAWKSLGDVGRAISFQQQAIGFEPDDPARWLQLAELYQAQGQSDRAEEARRRAAKAVTSDK